MTGSEVDDRPESTDSELADEELNDDEFEAKLLRDEEEWEKWPADDDDHREEVWTSVCTRPHLNREAKQLEQTPTPWDHGHEDCPRNTGELHFTRLLSTCRQIYSEAAFMPFTNNTFTFQNIWYLNVVLENVFIPAQRRAMRSIAINVPVSLGGKHFLPGHFLYQEKTDEPESEEYSGADDADAEYCKVTAKSARSLTGLRFLTLNLRVEDARDPRSDMSDDEDDDFSGGRYGFFDKNTGDIAYPDSLNKVLREYGSICSVEQLQLTSVNIKTFFKKPPRTEEHEGQDLAAKIYEWTRGAEWDTLKRIRQIAARKAEEDPAVIRRQIGRRSGKLVV